MTDDRHDGRHCDDANSSNHGNETNNDDEKRTDDDDRLLPHLEPPKGFSAESKTSFMWFRANSTLPSNDSLSAPLPYRLATCAKQHNCFQCL